MRKDLINIIAKLSKKIHLQQFAYSICKELLSLRKPKLGMSAEEYLQTISPQKKNSCLCENTIEHAPQYDLEIVIPVYNVELYIEECLLSIIKQKTRYQFLAVFVNDGSSDNSRDILERYSEYASIKIINTENQGVSAARNVALRHINARYVMFVDADDYLADGAIEELVTAADKTHADIVEGNKIYFNKDKILAKSVHVTAEGDNLLMHGATWAKVYKADLWKQISFPLDYRFEDTVNWMLIYQMPIKKVTIPNIVYYYRDTPTGFTRGYNKDKRRIETYWITKQLLIDAQTMHLKPTLFYYETFLRQCHLNTCRVAILGDNKANYALFEAQRQLRNIYFSQFHAMGQKEKRVETALLNNDYKEYLLYCLFQF